MISQKELRRKSREYMSVIKSEIQTIDGLFDRGIISKNLRDYVRNICLIKAHGNFAVMDMEAGNLNGAIENLAIGEINLDGVGASLAGLRESQYESNTAGYLTYNGEGTRILSETEQGSKRNLIEFAIKQHRRYITKVNDISNNQLEAARSN